MSESQSSLKDTAVNFMLKAFKPYLEDSEITEICVNQPLELFVERKGIWQHHEVSELTYEYLKHLSLSIASFAHESLGDTRPIVSAVLPQGERVQIVIPPACKDNTISLTIRKPSLNINTLNKYVDEGFFNYAKLEQSMSNEDLELLKIKEAISSCADLAEQAQLRATFLQKAVEFGKNIVISGETGSGKTTFMKTLMQYIPDSERIITIEDVPELMWGLPDHKNQVNLLYPSESNEHSVITAASLMRSCLRMKPDRILLAELRGGETFDFLNVCLSGHNGTITSCHAGNSKGVFNYLALKTMQSPVGRSLPFDIIMRLLHQVIEVIVCIHNDKQTNKGRHITEIWFEPLAKYQPDASLLGTKDA